MKSRDRAEKLLDTIQRGCVIEVSPGSYFYDCEEYRTTIQFETFRLLLVKNVVKTHPPDGTAKWARFTIEAKDIKTGKDFTFSCAKSDFLVKVYEDGENWEVLFG